MLLLRFSPTHTITPISTPNLAPTLFHSITPAPSECLTWQGRLAGGPPGDCAKGGLGDGSQGYRHQDQTRHPVSQVPGEGHLQDEAGKICLLPLPALQPGELIWKVKWIPGQCLLLEYIC